MLNQPTEWDRGFNKGLEIGQKIGFFENKIQNISAGMESISQKLSREGVNNGIIIELDECIAKLDNALVYLTNI